ncbi:hypothetical protein CISG_00162 [Coccidioides immitis RMSCC 3703]|uniref:Uncharacterized protein n=1 Tax=Coccidioides immitis RMSCC 3703 TaxID=454286 RepID=A0A0J8QHA0_COCIT|nr:hypothetical protein CISG_00162 [Coccidioides immitis RMSCC 3703]
MPLRSAREALMISGARQMSERHEGQTKRPIATEAVMVILRAQQRLGLQGEELLRNLATTRRELSWHIPPLMRYRLDKSATRLDDDMAEKQTVGVRQQR